MRLKVESQVYPQLTMRYECYIDNVAATLKSRRQISKVFTTLILRRQIHKFVSMLSQR